jgi:signal peptidase II
MQTTRGTNAVTTERPLALRGVYAYLLVTAAVVVGIDQITKQLALDRLEGDGVDILWGFLTLRVTFNPGGAFGVAPGLPWLFVVAAAVIGVVVLITARQADSKSAAIALGLVLGGGVGNIFDRVVRDFGGRVVDFIDLHWWPLFNVADAAIVCGVIFILWSSVRAGKDGDGEGDGVGDGDDDPA